MRHMRILAVMVGVLLSSLIVEPAAAQWRQWGGPDRNFVVEAKGLADSWPADGPKQLWVKPLGDGYSTIVVDGGVLYTMYRSGDDDVTVAMDVKTGETRWEHKNPAPVTDDRKTYGPGPYATPLIEGDRLFTVGTNSVMHCFDKKTGKVHWQHDLVEEFDALVQGFGFSSSPIAYRNTILLPVGRKVSSDAGETKDEKSEESAEAEKIQAQSLMAFDQRSGSLVWENRSYVTTKHNSTYSSPFLIEFAGRDQLVLFMATELAGLDPTNGNRLWGVPHTTKYDENMAMPAWNGKDTLVCSSAYGTGSRAIKLAATGGKTVPTELWYSKKMRVLHGNVVQIGDHVYGSSGDFGPTFLSAMNVATGKLAWRQRGFKKSTFLLADGKLIILDEDGKLALTTASPEKLTIHSTCELGLHGAWAVPTLVGKTLFVRDRERIMALDIG